MLSAPQILKKANYYIEYNNNDTNFSSIISKSWSAEFYMIQWDATTKTLFNTFDKTDIECPAYVAKSLVYLILNNILLKWKYPYEYVIFSKNEIRILTMEFGLELDSDSLSKSDDLLALAKEIVFMGFRPEHVALAKEFNIYDGLMILMRYYLNVTSN